MVNLNKPFGNFEFLFILFSAENDTAYILKWYEVNESD